MKHLRNADIVVAVLDGPDIDSGTAFEIGFAYSKRKCLVGIRTDPRISGSSIHSETSTINLMIEYALNHFHTELTGLKKQLEKLREGIS